MQRQKQADHKPGKSYPMKHVSKNGLLFTRLSSKKQKRLSKMISLAKKFAFFYKFDDKPLLVNLFVTTDVPTPDQAMWPSLMTILLDVAFLFSPSFYIRG
jgi:hypothetical protein